MWKACKLTQQQRTEGLACVRACCTTVSMRCLWPLGLPSFCMDRANVTPSIWSGCIQSFHKVFEIVLCY